MAANPMYQFNVYRIGPEIKIGEIDISFTNASLFMVISTLAILLIFNIGSKKKLLIPDKLQLLAELSYSFISKMINDTAGTKAKPYFSFIFSYSCSLSSLSFFCLSEISIFSIICDFLLSKLFLIFGNMNLDNIKNNIPKVIVNQKICENQNSGLS